MNSLATYRLIVASTPDTADWDKEHVRQSAVYVGLFAAVYCACNLIGRPQLASYVVLALNIVCYAIGFVPKTVFFSSFLLGNELSSFANILIGLFVLRKERPKEDAAERFRLTPIVWALIFLLLGVTVINVLALGTFVNAICSVVYYCFLGFLFWRVKGVYCKAELRNAVALFAYGELAIVLSTCILYGFSPSDANFGSIGNAHFLGVWCGLSLLILYACRKPWNRYADIGSKLARLIPYAALLIVLYYSDTKAPILCGIGAVLLALIIRGLFKTKTVIPALLSFVASFFILIQCLSIPAVEEALTNGDETGTGFFTLYVYSDETALKFDYFQDTTQKLLSEGKIVFGYGLGQYGSRFSNLFGYSFAYREDSAINRIIPQLVDSRMLEDYKEHASRYDSDFVDNIGNYSAVAAYPFSSLMAFLAEGGLIALLLLCFILRMIKPNRDAQLIFMFFLGCSAMDLYVDHIQLVGILVLVLASLRNPGERNHNSEDDRN